MFIASHFNPSFAPFVSLVFTAKVSGYDLIRVRENAESVAFFDGGTAEWSKFTALFDGLLMLS